MPKNLEELKHFEEQLEGLKAGVEKKLEELQKTPEFGSDVDHFEEEADEAEEFANKLGMEKELKDELNDIETALEKIRNNSYGRCENCGEEIDAKLLESDPATKLCKNCKLAGRNYKLAS